MNQFQDYKQFLRYMENNYDEEEQLIIEDFISYYMNQYRGFGHRNCEETYQDNLNYDKTGKLHEFALIGFEFEKKLHEKKLQDKKIKTA